MKFKKLTISLVTLSVLISSSCLAQTKTISEKELGLRKTDLYTEKNTVGDKTDYGKDPAGTSKRIERAFENAPPMIPHDVDGMLPITINNNACVGCHEPAVASSMGATPLPKSHFTNFRPQTTLAKNGRIEKEGKTIENTSDFKTIAKPLQTLSGSRFNCSQCHTPQSVGNDAPKNNFKADFRKKDSNAKSNLLDIMNEGVK